VSEIIALGPARAILHPLDSYDARRNRQSRNIGRGQRHITLGDATAARRREHSKRPARATDPGKRRRSINDR
jgi:hypothetical protein